MTAARYGMTDALQALVGALEDGGLSASLDGASIVLPGAWVWPGDIDPEFLSGDGSMTAIINVVAGDLIGSDAVADLDETLASVLAVVDPSDTMTTQLLTIPGGTTAYPSIRVPVRVTCHPTEGTDSP